MAQRKKRSLAKTVKKEELDARYLDHKSADGICDADRSIISPDYARNFICDFVIGKEQDYSMRQLF